MSEFDMTTAIEATAQMFEALAPLREFVEGYRADMIRRGFNESAAELMSITVHNELVTMILRSNSG